MRAIFKFDKESLFDKICLTNAQIKQKCAKVKGQICQMKNLFDNSFDNSFDNLKAYYSVT